MDQETPSYRSEFFKSKHHAWLGLLTLGMGFVFGADRPLFLLLGVAAYALGWIYLPDMPFFRRHIDGRRDASKQADATRELVEFQQKRDALLASLSPTLRRRYLDLTDVCRQIEKSTAGSSAASELADPRMRRLDELMWTFLRLLGLQDTLEHFLETERREDLSGRVRDTEGDIAALGAQIESLKEGNAALRASKEQLLQSRLEALDVLRKRLATGEQAQANLALVQSEQERLDQQIKLIRADAVAAKNTSSISARIDATVEQLDHTNKWLTEIGEFEDLSGGMPSAEGRLGYTPATQPPPIMGSSTTRDRRKQAQQ